MAGLRRFSTGCPKPCRFGTASMTRLMDSRCSTKHCILTIRPDWTAFQQAFHNMELCESGAVPEYAMFGHMHYMRRVLKSSAASRPVCLTLASSGVHLRFIII